MDTTLVTVTVLSMGMAAALSGIVWRLLREERRRSDARMAALSAAAAAAAARSEPSAPPTERAVAMDRPEPAERPVNRPAPVLAAFRKQTWVADAAADLPLRPTSNASAPVPGPLFMEPVRTPAWGNRLGIMVAIALVAASAVLFAMTARKARETAAARSASPVLATAPVEAGLELLALRDSRLNGTLTITGMVRNPRTASLLTRVTVTAYTFDDKGAFLASGRALLDVTSLAPGDDSPFVVTVPATEAVARYRIGFRGEDGRVIGHVDRRQQGPMAALRVNPEPTHW